MPRTTTVHAVTTVGIDMGKNTLHMIGLIRAAPSCCERRSHADALHRWHQRHQKVRGAPAGASKDRGLVRHRRRALRARRNGRSRFQLLQNALNKKAKLLYVVFDALFVGGKDIRQKPLLRRKEILKALLPRDPLLRYSEHVVEFGKRVFAKAQRAHEEGVIAKRAAGLYYSGKRTREWLKFKVVHEQEVVIVGYTEPRRSRKYFGSLVLAVRDKAKKRWVYAGHVGTGFDQAALKSIYGTMQPLRTDKKPFDQKVKYENATTWLIPKLVGEVKFTEWTSEAEMRHPVFLGLRTDKRALDVIREQP